MTARGLIAALLVGTSLSAGAARERQALEAFELSSLKLEAVHLQGKCQRFASIRDPGGYLHRAFKGDYVGKNFGLIVALPKRGMKIKERHETKPGEWIEKEIWIPLPQTADRASR